MVAVLIVLWIVLIDFMGGSNEWLGWCIWFWYGLIVWFPVTQGTEIEIRHNNMISKVLEFDSCNIVEITKVEDLLTSVE